MASITLNNTISFASTCMKIKVEKGPDKNTFIPYVLVPENIMNQISEKFDLICSSTDHHVQLFSLPGIIIDKGCTSGCTATVWSKIQDTQAMLIGNYTFAVEIFDESMFNWYIAAICENSALYLN